MREFYVIRLGRVEDQNKPRIFNNADDAGAAPLAVDGQVEQQEAPRPVRANRNRLDAFDGANQVRPRDNVSNEYGYHVRPADTMDKSGMLVHTSRKAAEAYAKVLAARHPQVMFGVFECAKVFETTEPTVIVKHFNDSNELVVE